MAVAQAPESLQTRAQRRAPLQLPGAVDEGEALLVGCQGSPLTKWPENYQMVMVLVGALFAIGSGPIEGYHGLRTDVNKTSKVSLPCVATLAPPAQDSWVAIFGVGAGTAVVVETTRDSATPRNASGAVADSSEDVILVSVDTNQHTSYGVNLCINDMVADQLVDFVGLDDGTECYEQSERPPFSRPEGLAQRASCHSDASEPRRCEPGTNRVAYSGGVRAGRRGLVYANRHVTGHSRSPR